MMKKYFLMIGLAVLYGFPVQAEESQSCTPQQDNLIAGYFNISTEQLNQRLLDSACKADPGNEQHSLVSYAFVDAPYTKENYAGSDEAAIQFIIARLDQTKILHKYQFSQQPDALFDVGANSLTIDTARYMVAPGTRAFGVRFTSAAKGPSAP